MPIPRAFNSNGVLEPGTYDATLLEIRQSLLVHGNTSPSWDAEWRNQLIDNAEVLVKQLWSVGVQDVFLDGSFVEEKDHPNDIDGYFDPKLSLFDPADIQKFAHLISQLNNLDPHKVWNWDHRARRSVPGFAKLQLPMWIFYRVEIYPHLDQGSGIKDAFGNDQKFPSAFRQSRNGFLQKGIIRVVR